MKWQIFSTKWVGSLLVMLAIACSAEDGEDGVIGPQGPQGEQGAAGPQGAQGEQGPPGADGQDGQDGTTNVVSSGWFEIDTWDNDLPDFKFHRIPDLTLSETQIENDLILVYRRYNPAPTLTQVALLPITEYDFTGETVLSLTNRVQGTGLVVQVQAFGRNVASDEYLGPETQFRYFIIPVDATTSKYAPDFSKMSFEEVLDYFGLDQ